MLSLIFCQSSLSNIQNIQKIELRSTDAILTFFTMNSYRHGIDIISEIWELIAIPKEQQMMKSSVSKVSSQLHCVTSGAPIFFHTSEYIYMKYETYTMTIVNESLIRNNYDNFFCYCYSNDESENSKI